MRFYDVIFCNIISLMLLLLVFGKLVYNFDVPLCVIMLNWKKMIRLNEQKEVI